MSSTAYLLRAPAGVPGALSRPDQSTVEPVNITPYGTTGAPAAFGLACQIDATAEDLRVVADPDAAAYGFLVRPYPSLSGNNAASQGLGQAVPPAEGVVGVMVRGYMTVKLGGSAAAVKGAAVYVWSSADSGAHVQGQVEAADPSTDGFVLARSYFMGPADADGNVEIGFNI